MAGETTAWVVCGCGVPVVNTDAHSLFHARLLDAAPLARAEVGDPETGALVQPQRPDVELTEATRAEELRAQAASAISSMTAYLAVSSPTNAQVVAQVRLLTQVVRSLIRLAARARDSTT